MSQYQPMRSSTPKSLSSSHGPRGITSPLLWMAIILAGCGDLHPMAVPVGDANTRVVSVAAAADLKFALEDLIDHFKRRHPAIKVKVTYGSSGSLFAQISQSAPFDMFFSADMDYPRKLIEGGFAGADGEFLYAEGHIVVWVPNASPLDLETLGIRAVTAPSARRVAIANPRHAPYGRAAEAALKNLGVYEEVRDRLVLGENVAQAAQFVASGAADVGIIARSLASAPSMRGEGRSWPVPTGAHPPLRQGGVILSRARDRDATRLFRESVTGEEGRDVFRRHGFTVPEG